MGYHNPKPLITFEPHLLVDQKNQKSFFQGGDVVFANGQTIPVPGGFDLPTTGLWHQLLDIPQVSGGTLSSHIRFLDTVFCSNSMQEGDLAAQGVLIWALHVQGAVVDGPVPAPFLAPAMPKAAAPAAAPLSAAAMDENTPLSFLIKGITDLANRTGRKLSQEPGAQQPGPQVPGLRPCTVCNAVLYTGRHPWLAGASANRRSARNY